MCVMHRLDYCANSGFNPNVTTFQSNCAEGLHFSAFILIIIYGDSTA